jgi:indolepyruvate ferredoxin oxidoreductase beta subunit
MDLIIVGVGGQGILTCSNILAKASMNLGLNVITSEVHGMAQRGGSVEVHVRIGDVLSPLIPLGSAEAMIALEPVEALRKVEYIGKDSLVIVNTKPIIPVSVTLGLASYPDVNEVIEAIKSVAGKVIHLNAFEIAKEAGDVRSANVVMLGAFAKHTELFTLEELEKAVKDVLPEKVHDVNLKALRLGYELA